jgi:hypothetical protein
MPAVLGSDERAGMPLDQVLDERPRQQLGWV